MMSRCGLPNPTCPKLPKSFAIREDLLLRVQKPARYIGNEVNTVRKETTEVEARIALAFPDVYEVGMSHLGLKILYSIVNNRPNLVAERAFAPWPDMEDLMRKEREPLRSLETGTPLCDFHIVGFSLQYELCATTVLQMLDLGGIPLRADDRGAADPFVVGGGPVVHNPLVLAPFFDAFAIGDGEELILELAETHIQWRRQGLPREELLKSWKQLPGVYVPLLHRAGDVVSRRIVADLEKAEFPSAPVIPFCETVHDRIGVEIARGCTRGCRFCQAGILYRPVREREADTIVGLTAKSLEQTGWEEVSLLSLSAGDYSGIVELIKTLSWQFGGDMVAISLPSLRPETLDPEMAEQIRKVRKTGFTLAPEAGTDRLRRVINKGNSEEDLEKAVKAAFKAGWQSLKLYFMIGLPTEKDEDLDGIVGLIRKASKWAGRGKITASISTFVPKSHTPFQWADQISIAETGRRQNYIRSHFNKGRVRVKFHDPKVSFLEGVLARGDQAVSTVVESVYKKGARFDGWDELLNLEAWMQAFHENGVDADQYLRQRPLAEKLPWSFIETGVHPQYLAQEWEKALSEQPTADCRVGECQGCGVCDFEKIQMRVASTYTLGLREGRQCRTEPSQDSIRRFRLRYEKRGSMRFLGHHDLVRVFHRAFRRTGLRLDYSKGFHPHPRLRFSPPLSVGIESVAEYLDFDLLDFHGEEDAVRQALGRHLPEGLTPLDLEEILLNTSSISSILKNLTYEIAAPESLSPIEIKEKIEDFGSRPTFEITVERKGKSRKVDLKQAVQNLGVNGSALSMTLAADASGPINPYDAASAILGRSREAVKAMKTLKISASFGTSQCETGVNNDGQ